MACDCVRCAVCFGTGRVWLPLIEGRDTCPECGGTGISDACEECEEWDRDYEDDYEEEAI